MSRQQAREDSFKMLFEAKIIGTPPEELMEKFAETIEDGDIWEQKSVKKRDMEYMKRIIFGVAEKEGEINEKIAPFLKNWTVARIAKVDLAILQLAIYEILYVDSVPAAVSANEAVELAKKYGGKDAPSFINGVLRSYIRENG